MEDVEGEKVDSAGKSGTRARWTSADAAAPPLLQATGGQETGRLPHSIPSYDLRSRAVTPGKTPLVDRVADERLGLSSRSHQASTRPQPDA
jgi:hypothetical protein